MKSRTKLKRLLSTMFTEKQIQVVDKEFIICEYYTICNQNTYNLFADNFSLDEVCDKVNKKDYVYHDLTDKSKYQGCYAGNNDAYEATIKYIKKQLDKKYGEIEFTFKSDDLDRFDLTKVYIYDFPESTDRGDSDMCPNFQFFIISNCENINYVLIYTGEMDNKWRMFTYRDYGWGVPYLPFMPNEDTGCTLQEEAEKEGELWYNWKVFVEHEEKELNKEQLQKYYDFYKATKTRKEAYKQFIEWFNQSNI